MFFVSLNIKFIGNRSKKFSLKRLINIHEPDILLLQETLAVRDSLIEDLNIFLPRWDFISIDVISRFIGLITGCRSHFFHVLPAGVCDVLSAINMVYISRSLTCMALILREWVFGGIYSRRDSMLLIILLWSGI